MSTSAETAPETPNSPFAAVPEPLRRPLEQKGFQSLTAVQTAILAAATAGRDLQVTSQTGSGKTVALGMAIAPALTTPRPSGERPIAVVIVPTRELAAQVHDELEWLFAGLPNVTLECVTGGTSVSDERHRLSRRPAVVVGTPGRLLDHATNGALPLQHVRELVLDEADQMLDMGFRDDLEAILGQMPPERRTILVSATFPPGVRSLTKRYQRDPLHVEGTSLGAANADIEHVAHLLNARDRYQALLAHLRLAADRRVLIFVRTREDTAGLADKLECDGFRALPISGDLTQAQRTRTLAAFKRGTIQALVATDVAARGLDIADVATVVHFDPPIDGAAYTHRSGRTGRAGQKGTSVLFVPRSQERGARYMLDHCRIRAVWRPVPSPADVEAHQRHLLQTHVERCLAATPQPMDLAFAQQLLADRDPAHVVAALLAELAGPASRGDAMPRPSLPPTTTAGTAARTTEPHPATKPPAAARAPVERAPHPAREPHPERPSPVRAPRPTHKSGEQVRFTINWGVADGADPRRILAHVCRRGGLESSDVGAIELDRYDSTFEVAIEVAEAFTKAVQARDARDPHLKIFPASGVATRFRKSGPPPRRPAPRKYSSKR